MPLSIFAYGTAPDWRRYSFDWQAGRPAAIVIARGVPPDTLRPLLDSFAERLASFAGHGADVLVLAAPEQAQALRATPSGIEIIDCDAAFLADSGAPAGQTLVVVVDRNLRVALHGPPGPPEQVVAACLACLPELACTLPAPVLVLPNLLPRSLCRTLIARFEDGDSIDGKVAGIDAAGRPRCYVDPAIKHRRDLQIPLDDPLHPAIRAALLERCAPEIAKAFQTSVTHTDRLMIARYDSPGGWFRRHRDNASANVAFREFAISVNLNTEDYDGGHLIFPEYNDQGYGPPTGGGLIFSASVLHEAVPVTRGRRYVLLTFFHGDRAEAERLAYLARMPI